MPYINSVAEQMLMDGPDGLESRLASDALEDCTERFGHETKTPRAAALARLTRGKGGIFPPYQRTFLSPPLPPPPAHSSGDASSEVRVNQRLYTLRVDTVQTLRPVSSH